MGVHEDQLQAAAAAQAAGLTLGPDEEAILAEHEAAVATVAPDPGEAAVRTRAVGVLDEAFEALYRGQASGNGHAPPPPDDEPPDGDPAPAALPAAASGVHLEIIGVRDLAARVDSAPNPGFLFRPVWPADAYGVLAAKDKVGKTWAIADAVVAAAAGKAWMDAFPYDQPGPVLVFLGEGGERKMLRRLRAVATFHGVELEGLPIRICMRAPHLTREGHLRELAAEVDRHRPRLVIVDPLYLAARGSKGSDLYAMGEALEGIQRICQQVGASLLISHHWNKTGEGKGPDRMSGVGPAAWGRVLVSAVAEHRRTDPDGASVVVVAFEFTGDEIPDVALRVRRKVWAEDPDDLASPMHYEATPVDDPEPAGDPRLEGLSKATLRVFKAIAGSDVPLGVRAIGDVLAEGIPLKGRTIQKALKDLSGVGAIDQAGEGLYGAALYLVTDPSQRVRARDHARDRPGEQDTADTESMRKLPL